MSDRQFDSMDDAPPQDGAPLSPRRFWSALLCGCLALAVLIGLGAWQVERLYWKEGLIAHIDARIHGPAATIDEIVAAEAQTGDIDYRPVTLTGRFIHDAERTFLSTRQGTAGWNVFTPLVVEGGRYAVFVNRGFVPYALKDPQSRAAGQVEGQVAVTGLARNAEHNKPGGFFLPDNDPQQDVFFWRSIPDMAVGLDLPEGAQLLDFTIDAGEGAAPGGYPVGGQTVVTMPNNHLEYAITWFGIAAALAVMLAVMVVSQWRRRGLLT
ncbi:SURF1 family protein [Aureimonas frigidaquae]|uniref:SURF1 family protein n=1 Tax=Aureimonas frigidaquae TaxID=424757 RepID=UPI000A864CF4|nr:SURF1 family protein [Aureimonas frigidaquae]